MTTYKFCSNLAREYALIQEPLWPCHFITAIFGLPVFPKYLSCDDCSATFRVKASMLRHMKESNDCVLGSYHEHSAQAYFPGSKRMFFGVIVPNMSLTNNLNIPMMLIKKFYLPPPFHALPIASAMTFWDANHFLRVENWEKHVEGMTGEGIQKVIREHEPELRQTVLPIVEVYMIDVVKELSGTDHAVKVAIGDYNG